MKLLGAGKLMAAVAAVTLSTAAWAQGPESGPGPMGPHRPPMERSFGERGPMGRWWNNPKIVEKLKLTDDQRKVFDQILLDHREKLIDLKANLEKAEIPMQSLVDADQPDEGKILAQIDKTAQARAELEKANARYLLALRAKLSQDQWKQLKELHEHRGEAMRDRFRDRRPGPDAGKDGAGTPPPAPGPQGMLDDGPDDGTEAGPAR